MVYVPGAIAPVLTVAEKTPALPVNPVEVAVVAVGVVLMLILAICPVGATWVGPAPALSLPARLMLAVPWVIVCEAVKALKVGVALPMVSGIVVAGPAGMLL